MTRQDWRAAIRELENFGDGHRRRREKEARLLYALVGSGGP
jgi:hypothetical protein